jgi:hypothetical protein
MRSVVVRYTHIRVNWIFGLAFHSCSYLKSWICGFRVYIYPSHRSQYHRTYHENNRYSKRKLRKFRIVNALTTLLAFYAAGVLSRGCIYTRKFVSTWVMWIQECVGSNNHWLFSAVFVRLADHLSVTDTADPATATSNAPALAHSPAYPES